ncbi:MAG: leucine-rich repeat domain-containing protein [Clostridia bacterium]|nr:leucine-rich repeat domain-containing protein [Clostridia bacterium]
MKKIFSILLIAVITMLAVFTMVGCGEPSGNPGEKGISCIKQDGKYVVYKYVDEGLGVTELDIDAVVKTKYGETAEVSRIKEGAFDGNSTLEKVIVPNTVTKIDGGAFKNMKALKDITLPFVGSNVNADAYEGQTLSEDKAVDAERLFGYIFGTEEYTGGAKITQTYNAIEGTTATYYVPMSLRTVTIAPKDNYEIPMYAFSGLTLVTKIDLNDKVIGIGERAFYNANCFAKLDVPTTVTNIYKGAFENFSSLEKIYFGGTPSQWEAIVKGTNWNLGVAENFAVKFGE